MGARLLDAFNVKIVFSLILFRYKMRMKKMLEDEDDLELDRGVYSADGLNSSADTSMLSINS